MLDERYFLSHPYRREVAERLHVFRDRWSARVDLVQALGATEYESGVADYRPILKSWYGESREEPRDGKGFPVCLNLRLFAENHVEAVLSEFLAIIRAAGVPRFGVLHDHAGRRDTGRKLLQAQADVTLVHADDPYLLNLGLTCCVLSGGRDDVWPSRLAAEDTWAQADVAKAREDFMSAAQEGRLVAALLALKRHLELTARLGIIDPAQAPARDTEHEGLAGEVPRLEARGQDVAQELESLHEEAQRLKRLLGCTEAAHVSRWAAAAAAGIIQARAVAGGLPELPGDFPTIARRVLTSRLDAEGDLSSLCAYSCTLAVEAALRERFSEAEEILQGAAALHDAEIEVSAGAVEAWPDEDWPQQHLNLVRGEIARARSRVGKLVAKSQGSTEDPGLAVGDVVTFPHVQTASGLNWSNSAKADAAHDEAFHCTWVAPAGLRCQAPRVERWPTCIDHRPATPPMRSSHAAGGESINQPAGCLVLVVALVASVTGAGLLVTLWIQ